MIHDFASKKCVACEGGVPPIPADQAREYLKETTGWGLAEDEKKIRREFKFKGFKEAMVFVNKVADIANEEDHHP
ncbi:MAG: 4a-hydroxytetrahydrobiopterin dehydratase, partial [Patescibacteria group bacterium]|nr:4a-hydroxytetrahydrobiopterin dehydratase [Patescibacteria group bacterium]